MTLRTSRLRALHCIKRVEEKNSVCFCPSLTWTLWGFFIVFFFFLEAVEIGADMPSDEVVDKWLGEPIKAAILPTSIFLTNKKGFPVLSKAHQRIIFRLFKVQKHGLFYEID